MTKSQLIGCQTCTGRVLKTHSEQEMLDKLYECVHDERRFICTGCDESYDSERDAENCCDAEVNIEYLCPICGEGYMDFAEYAYECCIPKLRCVPRKNN